MIWRLLRRTAASGDLAAWWQQADRVARAPSAESIAQLSLAIDPNAGPDALEQQEEMIDGLRQLARLAGRPDLPVVATQHRVIGADPCHFMTPVSPAGHEAAPGKVFLTSRRLVLVAGTVTSRPWHRVGRIVRSGRLLVAGSGDTILEMRCNSYGDALAVEYIAGRLLASARRA